MNAKSKTLCVSALRSGSGVTVADTIEHKEKSLFYTKQAFQFWIRRERETKKETSQVLQTHRKWNGKYDWRQPKTETYQE